MKYRKKPIVVEAIRWTGDNGKEIEAFCGTDVMFGTIYEPDPVSAACIHTLNGLCKKGETCKNDSTE